MTVNLHQQRLEAEGAVALFGEYDLILDGTDNFATRYLVNDAAVLAHKPYVWGSIYRFEGRRRCSGRTRRTGGHQLSGSVPAGAAAGDGALLRRGRSAGHPVRVDRVDHGYRGDQVDLRDR